MLKPACSSSSDPRPKLAIDSTQLMLGLGTRRIEVPNPFQSGVVGFGAALAFLAYIAKFGERARFLGDGAGLLYIKTDGIGSQLSDVMEVK
eukprot:3606935-Amphidinium_carterae.1